MNATADQDVLRRWILLPEQVLVKGFKAYTGLPNDIDPEEALTPRNVTLFKKLYGSSPTIVAFIWSDIITSPDEGAFANKNISDKGFKQFLIAIHFLWAYPKNAEILALAFGVSVNLAQGKKLWDAIAMIAGLKTKVIVWPSARYEDPNGTVFIISVDGVDFKTWEPKHTEMPYDKSMMSHKFTKAAWKYEVALDIYSSKCVWVSPKYKGGVHDKVIFLRALRGMVPAGKKVIVDRVYGSKAQHEDHEILALPNLCDPAELQNFKARVRSRHETFNGRLRFFHSLYSTFRHNQDKHELVFYAVVAMVQYQMDHGSPIFDP